MSFVSDTQAVPPILISRPGSSALLIRKLLPCDGVKRGGTRIRREFQCFRSKRPEKAAFVSKILQQSLIFNKRRFSPPGVLVYESHGGCAGDSANAELGSGAIAAFE
jgi:hypothetical protein